MEEIKLAKNGRHISAKSLANLIPCKKGETHNPHGRPLKEKSVTECLRRLMKTPAGKGKTKEQLLAEVWYEKAKTDTRYFEMLLDRLEGKVTQPIGGEGGKDLIFTVVVSNEQVKDMVGEVLSGKRSDATRDDKGI
ncbi:MAG: hypothetical protein ABSF21_00910 [Dehalococcoidia bacterium]